MRRFNDDVPIRASLLDRFPCQSDDHLVKAGRQDLKGLIRSVHENLEVLLNTRWRAAGPGPGHDELGRSLINYGIPDFATQSVASPEGQEKFRQLVVEAIVSHEPRFFEVKVEISETENVDRSLHFRIQGELHAQPENAHVAFDSRLEPGNQRIRIKSIENV